LGGFSSVTSGGASTFIVSTNSQFSNCTSKSYPIFSTSAKVVSASNGTCTLSSGQQIALGACTSGLTNLALGADVVVNGVVNTDQNVVQAYTIAQQ
jgi:hypothetical protein